MVVGGRRRRGDIICILGVAIGNYEFVVGRNNTPEMSVVVYNFIMLKWSA